MSNSSTYDSVRATAEQAEDKALRAGNELKGKVTEAASNIQNEAKTQMDRLSISIRDKPLQSAAIAAGLGFLFAVVARR